MLEENRKRMLELGLLEAANDIRPKARPVKPKLTPLNPIRRSSRIKATTTVSYSELRAPKEKRARKEKRAHKEKRAYKEHYARYVPKLRNVPPYSGPVRRSSRLQATTAVSYKDQLDDDADKEQVDDDSDTVVLSHWPSDSDSESESESESDSDSTSDSEED